MTFYFVKIGGKDTTFFVKIVPENQGEIVKIVPEQDGKVFFATNYTKVNCISFQTMTRITLCNSVVLCVTLCNKDSYTENHRGDTERHGEKTPGQTH